MNKDFPLLDEADFDDLTPIQVEKMARYLTRELGETRLYLKGKRKEVALKRHDLKVAMASTRFNLSGERREDGKTYTEQQKDDKALLDNQELSLEVDILEVEVELGKDHISILKAQSDLVRSVMVSVRTSNEMDRN